MYPNYASAGVRTDRVCFLVRGALGRAECERTVAEAEGAGFLATGRDYPASYRDNARCVRDDAALAAALFERLRPHLPGRHVDAAGCTWHLHGLNPRFRFCRYREGQRFCVHQDGAWQPEPHLRTHLTCMLYLNDAGQFRGGHTRYYAGRTEDSELLGTVAPEAGTAIVFDHALWHDGEAVTHGTKYVMRTDVLYALEDEAKCAEDGAGVLAGHRGYVWSVRALRDGRLVTASRDCTVRLWRPEGGGWTEAQVLRGHQASVVGLAEDAAGHLWSVSRDRRVLRWEGGEAREVGRHEGAGLCVAALPDGRVATGGADGRVALWTADGQSAGVLRGHTGWVWALAALPDGRLASASEDGTLRVWELAAGNSAVLAAGAPLRALAVAPGGRLFTGAADGRVARYAPTLRREGELQAHAGAVCGLAVGAGLLVSGGEDDRVRIWDAATLAARGAWAHGNFVRGVSVLPDGRVASASYDGCVRVGPA